ncbi:MAG: exosome complex protein Rrp4 [Desulfurococcaceae archaeon]|jgi:exosome complex component RRP4|nr:exosome complex protein Rrp4 [Desulfurococcaceae archaeon]
MSKSNSTTPNILKRIITLPGDIVTPPSSGEIADPYGYLYKDKDVNIVTVISLLDIEEIGDKIRYRLIPLKFKYIPKEGDIVVGIVRDVSVTSWIIDINSPYYAILNASDYLGRPFNPATENIRKYLDVGDVILAKVVQFDRTRNPVLTTQDKDLGKVVDGSLIELDPSKVPRVIGRKRSMITMLEELTQCKIIVGINGRIILRCPNPEYEYIAVLAIKKIERESHTLGLTERIRSFIIEEKVKRGLIKHETG